MLYRERNSEKYALNLEYTIPTMYSDGTFSIKDILSNEKKEITVDKGFVIGNIIYKGNFSAINEALLALSLGMDFAKYTFFKKFIPVVVGESTVKLNEYFVSDSRNPELIIEENIRFAIDFVFESALRLQEFGYK